MKRSLAVGLVLVIVATVGVSTAAKSRDARDEDQERARNAFERGEILPITEILALASQHLPGDVVEVELKFEDNYISYEIDVLTSTGKVREIELDARNGAVIEIDN